MEYRVDLQDVKFQLFEWLDIDALLESERFADWEREDVEMVLDEALTFAQEQLAPLNEPGDRSGVTWEEGRVRLPAGFKEAYELYREGGWVGATAKPEHGGLGLPELIGMAAIELFAGANLSFMLTNTLTRGVANLIDRFGTGSETAVHLCAKLVSGEWAGTMCLTEPQAGSDLGATACRAEPLGDGHYLVRGEKIFITSGEHDLTENIVHAVLARLPDAPLGTKGLSLLIVPKIRVKADGGLGEPNDVYCSGIEHKLGLHASPTCSLAFGQEGRCEGYLLGEPHDGMRQMFQMMNEARIEVGLQGVAVAGAAHQAALAYARERRQMQHWTKMRDRNAPRVAIVEHPDVRRTLLGASSYVQAIRALLYQTSLYIDLAHASEGEEHERYQSYVDLLTPVCKAWGTDWGCRAVDASLQVFGGYGYTSDYPAEQYLRDVRITPIYEGTNAIQALDFVGRKLRTRGGAALGEMLERVSSVAGRLAGDARLGGAAAELASAAETFSGLLREIPGRDDAPLVMMLNAAPLLDMFGTVLGGAFLLEQAELAAERLAERGGTEPPAPGSEAAFYHNKVCSAAFFAYRVLPTVAAQAVAIRAGETSAVEAVF